MAIKGHAKIELTDVHNGGKEVIESDNIVTNGAANFMKPIGAFYNPYNNFSDPLVTTLYGGLILWDGNIEEDANKYTKPSNVSMVGNAYYGYKNTSDVPELGSYNAFESEVASDHVKFVYDFTTNEGNGEIACLSLVHKSTGMIGFGNKSGKYIDYANSVSIGTTGGAMPHYNRCMYIDKDSGNITYVIKDNNSVTLQKVKSKASSKISLFNNNGVIEERIFKKTDLHSYDSFQLSSVYIKDYFAYICSINERDNEVTLSKFNLKTFELVNTKIDVLKSESINYGSFNFMYMNNCIYIYSYNTNNFFILNIETGEKINNVQLNDGCVYNISDKEFIVFNDTRDEYGAYIFNSEKMELYRINYNAYFYNGNNAFFYSGEDGDVYNTRTGFSRNPFYLGTINNLGTPVTKTADKTMKITYTLTEA